MLTLQVIYHYPDRRVENVSYAKLFSVEESEHSVKITDSDNILHFGWDNRIESEVDPLAIEIYLTNTNGKTVKSLNGTSHVALPNRLPEPEVNTAAKPVAA